MKKIMIHLCLMLAFPVLLSAQYSGGNGRGDAFAECTQVPVSLNEKTHTITEFLVICQNAPNPFTATTSIKFTMLRESQIRIVLFDIIGREIRVLTEGIYLPGIYTLNMDASELQGGIYVYKAYAGDLCETRKMTVIK